MAENPYAPPAAPVGERLVDDDQIKAVAGAQRLLLISVLASLIGNALMRSSEIGGLLLLPIALCIAGFSIWCVYKLCKALGISPVLWIIAMFVPLINLICLVILNQKATTFLKAHGVSVGLLGARG